MIGHLYLFSCVAYVWTHDFIFLCSDITHFRKYCKKVNRKDQEEPQAEVAANS